MEQSFVAQMMKNTSPNFVREESGHSTSTLLVIFEPGYNDIRLSGISFIASSIL